MSQTMPAPPNRSTHFLFEHKVFSVENCRFLIAKSTDEPVMRFALGKNDAEVVLDKLCVEFAIDPKSFDGQLLDMVKKGLKYVREIRPGDTIPNELIDGTASWRVDDRHYMVAKGRLTVQLVTWLTGGETVISSPEQLAQVVDDPATKGRVQEAFKMIADKLALSDGGGEEEVGKRMEGLAKELAYIEALRERAAGLSRLRTGLETAARLYKNERATKDEIVRMQTLSLPPLTDLEGRFTQIDAQTCEVLSMLNKYTQNVAYIREMRDDLHTYLLQWDEVIDGWSAATLDKGPALDQLLKKTYQYLARRFSQASTWRLAARLAPR